jgi:hypothetical protein
MTANVQPSPPAHGKGRPPGTGGAPERSNNPHQGDHNNRPNTQPATAPATATAQTSNPTTRPASRGLNPANIHAATSRRCNCTATAAACDTATTPAKHTNIATEPPNAL